VANIVWGSVSPSCDYQPGNPNTQWTFGCSLGVPPNEGIGANVGGWNFNTTSGSPLMQYDPGDVLGGALRAAGSSGGTMPAHEASKRVPSPDLLGTLRFTGEVHVSQAVSLARLRVVIDRTLYAHDLAREVAQTPAKRRLRPFTLRYARGGLFISTRRGGPRVRLRLRRLDNRGRVKLDLVIIGVRTRHIRTLCGDVLGADLLNGRTLDLETRLRIRDGHSIQTLTLRQGWRCRSDRRGDFAGITPIRPRPVVRRPGLAVRLRLPRTVAPGRSVPALVTIINRRSRRAQRVVSALWHLRIFATAGRRARMTRVRELRAGRSITVRFTVPLRVDHGRACVTVEARADSARVAVARRCVPIAAATPSRAAARDSEPPVSAFANATTIDRPLAAPAFVLGSWCSASNVGSAPSPCIPSMGLSAHGGRWAGM